MGLLCLRSLCSLEARSSRVSLGEGAGQEESGSTKNFDGFIRTSVARAEHASR